MEINVPDGYNIQQIYNNKNMLIAVGIHSYGVGCTTTGVLFSNIIGRMYDYEVDNISVYQNNFLDKIYRNLNDKSNEYDLGILELNFINQNDNLIKQYLRDTILLMKEKCNQLICWFSIPASNISKLEKITEIIITINDEHILFLDMSCLYNKNYESLCTSSVNFSK